jgi:hypothetical protein
VVAEDVAEAEARDAGLAGAEEFARAADLEVAFGDFEAVFRRLKTNGSGRLRV